MDNNPQVINFDYLNSLDFVNLPFSTEEHYQGNLTTSTSSSYSIQSIRKTNTKAFLIFSLLAALAILLFYLHIRRVNSKHHTLDLNVNSTIRNSDQLDSIYESLLNKTYKGKWSVGRINQSESFLSHFDSPRGGETDVKFGLEVRGDTESKPSIRIILRDGVYLGNWLLLKFAINEVSGLVNGFNMTKEMADTCFLGNCIDERLEGFIVSNVSVVVHRGYILEYDSSHERYSGCFYFKTSGGLDVGGIAKLESIELNLRSDKNKEMNEEILIQIESAQGGEDRIDTTYYSAIVSLNTIIQMVSIVLVMRQILRHPFYSNSVSRINLDPNLFRSDRYNRKLL